MATFTSIDSTTKPKFSTMNKLKEAMKKHIMSKSQAAKKAASGKDLGKKGKNFEKIAAKAGASYGSAESGKKVAGAVFQKLRKSGKL